MSRANSELRGAMIFNVGARRSGTYWLQRIVTSHPEVSDVPSETHLLSHGISPLFERFHHGLRNSTQVGEVWIDRNALLDATRDFCDAVFLGHREPGASRIAERTPLHALHLGLIAELYPDARVVHIIRDGRDVARSITAQEWGPETIAAAAAEWRDTVMTARAAGIGPDSYRELRYEDLLADPENEIRDLFAWLGLSTDPRAVGEALAEASRKANLKRGSGSIGTDKWRDSFSQADREAFMTEAGTLLADLGYETQAEAATAAPRKASTPSVTPRRSPLAAVRHLLRRRPAATRADPDATWMLQKILDQVVAALIEGRPEELAELITPEAPVRVDDGRGSRHGRGREGLALLDRLGREEDEGKPPEQLRGEVHPSLPTSSAVLTLQSARGGPFDLLCLIGSDGRRVTALHIYRFPLGPGGGGR